MSIFVSYRRDDAAGHAGRLCDDLVDRLGPVTVFQDVDSIAPGEDFLSSIQRAIESADVALVVIGPDWATVRDQHGSPRLNASDDIVRMEVATALSSGKPVVPVLVGGASMPAAADLPPDIAPLTRRQAVEVRSASWDEDTDRLVGALPARAVQRRVPAEPRRRRGVTAAVLGVAAVVGVAIMVATSGSGGSSSDAPPSSVPALGSSEPPGSADESLEALDLPPVARTVLHQPSSNGFMATVDSASLSAASERTDGVGAQVTMTFENHDAYDAFLDPSGVQLVADGIAVNSEQVLGLLVPARAGAPATFDFRLPSRPEELVVRVNLGDEVGEIPLTGPRVVPAEQPTLAPALPPVDVGTSSFTFGAPEVDVYSDRYLVGIPIHLVNNDRYSALMIDTDYRLLIDGDPRAPVGVVNELVPANSSADATVRWEVPFDATSLILRIEHMGGSVDLPITAG